jgi:hypothetical protein
MRRATGAKRPSGHRAMLRVVALSVVDLEQREPCYRILRLLRGARKRGRRKGRAKTT